MTHALEAISGALWLLRSEINRRAPVATYNPPSRNRPETITFDLRDICNCQTFLTGSARMKISAEILGTELAIKKLRVSIQTFGMVLSQNPWTGWHEKMETKRISIPQEMTNKATRLVRIAKPRPGNSDRYRRRMETLMMGKVIL